MSNGNAHRLGTLTTLAGTLVASTTQAAVLPDDRADAMYHSYDGGGVTVDGPSLLLRKKFAEKYSAAANFYMDMVSSASIDVVSTASPYEEERTQGSLAFDMLQGKTQYSLSYALSDESDYTSNTASFDITQDMFGDLTTLSFGFSQGWDDVRKRGDAAFDENVDRRNYRVSLSQILTPKLMAGLNYEVVTDEGFLNNPYRSVRYLDESSPRGYSYQAEVYPSTRTSNAVSLTGRYYLPHRAAVHGEYRWYGDTWGVDANTIAVVNGIKDAVSHARCPQTPGDQGGIRSIRLRAQRDRELDSRRCNWSDIDRPDDPDFSRQHARNRGGLSLHSAFRPRRLHRLVGR